MSSSKDSDGLPDFSFLGDDAVQGDPGQFDFSTAEQVEQSIDAFPDDSAPEESAAPDFPDAESLNFDGPESAETPCDSSPLEPVSPPEPANEEPIATASQPKKNVRRLTPKAQKVSPLGRPAAAKSEPSIEPSTEPEYEIPESPFEDDKPQFDVHASAFEVHDSAHDDNIAGNTTTEDVHDGHDDRQSSKRVASAAVVAVTAGDMVSKKTFSMIAGYAAAITLLFVALVASGRLSLTGPHPLESLPDIAPLRDGEFRKVSDATSPQDLPYGHALTLGQSQRFGDVIFTPVRVTREPLRFSSMLTGSEQKDMTTAPVLKLWFTLQNASASMAFPPWDVGLMSHRFPMDSTEDNTAANSWLMVTQNGEEKRILNYLHSPNSSFDLIDQNSRTIVDPGSEVTSFIACSDQIAHIQNADAFRWRLQIRKGVNPNSGNGVTTLIDVTFSQSDVES